MRRHCLEAALAAALLGTLGGVSSCASVEEDIPPPSLPEAAPAPAVEAPPALGGPGDADPATEVQALVDEYRKANDTYIAPFRRDMTDEERAKVPPLRAEDDPANSFLPRFRALAARARGTDAALTALLWIVDRGGLATPGGTEAMGEALAEIAASHAASPRLEDMAQRLRYLQWRVPRQAVVRVLRTLIEKSSHRGVRGASLCALAAIESGGWAQEPPEGQEPDWDLDAREWTEAGQLLRIAVRDCANTPWADRAAGLLRERDHLQVGMKAPDFEAVDAEGQAFRLSDYRGKVVVLDFWGFG